MDSIPGIWVNCSRIVDDSECGMYSPSFHELYWGLAEGLLVGLIKFVSYGKNGLWRALDETNLFL